MAYNLFLDDNFTPPQIADLPLTNPKDKIRYRTYRWTQVNSFQQFIETILEKGLPSIVSFDHDLDPEHYELIFSDENWNKEDEQIIINYDCFTTKTGYHAAEWLMEYCFSRKLEMPLCLIHSQNNVGKKNIENLLF